MFENLTFPRAAASRFLILTAVFVPNACAADLDRPDKGVSTCVYMNRSGISFRFLDPRIHQYTCSQLSSLVVLNLDTPQ